MKARLQARPSTANRHFRNHPLTGHGADVPKSTKMTHLRHSTKCDSPTETPGTLHSLAVASRSSYRLLLSTPFQKFIWGMSVNLHLRAVTVC
jgi:hypothetical protein